MIKGIYININYTYRMHKKNQEKHSVKPSVNLFSLLVESDDEEKPIVNAKINIIEDKPKNKPIQQNHISNNIEDEMFKQYYGRKVYKTNEKKHIKPVNDDGFKSIGKKKKNRSLNVNLKILNQIY